MVGPAHPAQDAGSGQSGSSPSRAALTDVEWDWSEGDRLVGRGEGNVAFRFGPQPPRMSSSRHRAKDRKPPIADVVRVRLDDDLFVVCSLSGLAVLSSSDVQPLPP